MLISVKVLLWSALAVAYRGSAAEKHAAKEGRVVLAEVHGELDPRPGLEIAVAERMKDGQCRVLLFSPVGEEGDDVRFESLFASTARRCERVYRLAIEPLIAPDSHELVVITEESSPDERGQHLHIIGQTRRGLSELLAQSVFVPKNSPAEAEPAYAFGDPTPRFMVRDSGAGAAKSVVWIRGPQLLELERGAKEKVPVVIGAYQTVFRWDAAQERFLPDDEPEVLDFAPAKVAWEVEATIQAPKIWGTAQPFWGADGALESAWSVPSSKAKGAALKVSFRQTQELALLRLVPGCAVNKESWTEHDRVRAFRLELSSGVQIKIDRAKLSAEDPALRGVGAFPLNAEFGEQILVLLTKSEPVRWVRLVIEQVEPAARRRGVEAETCVSELSLH